MDDADALAESHHILILLNTLFASDPNATRRADYKSAATIVRKCLR
ncbi:MAG: hypothetical protein NT080_11710 [Spirochaetes bacterium]|nr:hypothetical protein [Spirochaetota bacterium]